VSYTYANPLRTGRGFLQPRYPLNPLYIPDRWTYDTSDCNGVPATPNKPARTFPQAQRRIENMSMKFRRGYCVWRFSSVLALLALCYACAPRNRLALSSCYSNLRVIDGAKEQLRRESGLKLFDPVDTDELLKGLPGNRLPECSQGGHYSIGGIGESPRCSYSAHNSYFIEGNER
jgi:hypothetical protein